MPQGLTAEDSVTVTGENVIHFPGFRIFRPQAALGTGVSSASCANVHLRGEAIAAKGGGGFTAHGAEVSFQAVG